MNEGIHSIHPGRSIALAVAGLLLLLTASSVTSLAAPAAPLTLTVVGPAQPVTAGQTFLVTVRVSQVSNLGAFEFDASFNDNVLNTNPDWMALTGFLSSTGRTTGELRLDTPANPDQPVFGAYSYGTMAGPSGAGDLATIQFHAVAAGTSAVSLTNVQVTDIEANTLPVTVIPGSVTVSAATTARQMFLPMILRRP